MISILLPNLRGGGAERVGVDLGRAFVSLGHEVELVLMRSTGVFLTEARREFRVTGLQVERGRQIPAPLARYLKARRPAALIANMWPLTSFAALAKVMSGWRGHLLLVEHTTLSHDFADAGRIHNLLMRISIAASYRWADSIAAVSRGSAQDMARLSGLEPGAIATLYNPVPDKRVPSTEAIALADRLWNCGPGSRILAVGNLKAAKNHSLLLRAFAHLPEDNVLMLVGEGSHETALRVMASELGIANRVIFAGFHDDPSAFYVTADAFVLSSRYEGFGNVIVEALSFGLPVVSTDCPWGPAEILENGRYGQLVPTGAEVPLARAIKKALAEPIDREALRLRAAHFSPERVARMYLDLMGLA